MRVNTKHTFSKKEERPALSLKEVQYWKGILEKICKIGFEHEFNLPDQKGTCKGELISCPCTNPSRETIKCHTNCMDASNCKYLKSNKCPGIYCIHFKSPCPMCNNAQKDCRKCSDFKDPEKEPEKIRYNIKKTLRPTENLSHIGKSGVMSVIDDGSLLGRGGVEVTTVGRRVDYDSFYEQAKTIIEEVSKRNGYVNERTSTHMHLVAGYFELGRDANDNITPIYAKKKHGSDRNTIKELEKPVPEIILANFHQLIRRYHNALTWITSSGACANNLTRWVRFRQPVLGYSASLHHMITVTNKMRDDIQQSGKYGFVSYYNTEFDEQCNVSRLHIEARYCDGLMSPTAIASLGILLYALMIKAVVLSKYGILHSGDDAYLKQANTIMKVLLNNNGNYDGPRHSDTRSFTPFMEIVRKQAEEMITMLKPELRAFPSALNALTKLADLPCSMRLVNGDSWETIEKDLCGNSVEDSLSSKAVLEVIDTLQIDECVDIEEWNTAVSRVTSLIVPEVARVTKLLTKENTIIWDNLIGSFVRC